MRDIFKKITFSVLLNLGITLTCLKYPSSCCAFSLATSNEPSKIQLKSLHQLEDLEIIQEVDKSWSLVSLGSRQEISKCFELKPPFQELYFNKEESNNSNSATDELELLFETKKRYFQFLQQNICVRTTSFGCGNLGHEIWPSSLVLSMYLCANKNKIQHRNILELGAGVGLPSLVCRDDLGAASVVATDFWKEESFEDDNKSDSLDVNMPTHWHGENLQYNVQDISKNAFTQSLDWTNPESTRKILEKFDIDIVIGSDLIYYEHVMHPLWNTLEILLERVDEVILFSPLIAKGKRQALPAFRDLLESKNKRGLYRISMEEFQMYGSDGSRFLKMSIERRNK